MGEATIDSTDKPVGAASKKSAKKEEPKDTIWSRRDFFSLAGWAGFAATLGFSTLFFTRLLFTFITMFTGSRRRFLHRSGFRRWYIYLFDKPCLP